MHTYNGLGVTVLRDAQEDDPDVVPGSDITIQVLVQDPHDPRLVNSFVLPIPPQGIVPPTPGRCFVVPTADLLPADITQPLPPDYVDNS
jgi:hypothetical protein